MSFFPRKVGVGWALLLVATLLNSGCVNHKSDPKDITPNRNLLGHWKPIKDEMSPIRLDASDLPANYRHTFEAGTTNHFSFEREGITTFLMQFRSHRGHVIAALEMTPVPASQELPDDLRARLENFSNTFENAKTDWRGEVQSRFGHLPYISMIQPRYKCLIVGETLIATPDLKVLGYRVLLAGSLCNPLTVPISNQQRKSLARMIDIETSALPSLTYKLRQRTQPDG